MKRVTKYKKLISFVVVLIVLISIFTIPANATWNPTSKNRFGAWLGSALLALNITLNSTVAPIEQMYEYLADPVLGNVSYEYAYNTDWEDDIMDRAVIKITPDIITIDGQEYTDIWISNEAAEKFRVNAFDFVSGYSIASQTNGTFASGQGMFEGVPIYMINNERVSQVYDLPNVGTYNIGNFECEVKQNSFNERFETTYLNGVTVGNGSAGSGRRYLQFRVNTNNQKWQRWNGSERAMTGGNYVESPFDFDYVAGTIPADEVLPSDYGMSIRVPSDTPGLQTFITNNVDFTVNTGKEIDFNLDPTIEGKLDDLIDIIAPILVNVSDDDVTFNTMPETPIPVPDVPIVDATVDQVTQPIINEITNYGDQITQQIPNIIETIPTIDDICNNIDTAPYHDLDTGLDRLPSFFLPFITDLRSALGIWHYVTEWLAQISTTFAFVSGCLVGTSIMTPIYAAIAGFMCIKVYRRMTV